MLAQFGSRQIYVESSKKYLIHYLCPMRGAIAGGDEFTVASGARILEEGGNAFDAYIAAQFTAFHTEWLLTSPAGGGFIMTYNNGKTSLIDGFTQTPLSRKPYGKSEFYQIEIDYGTTTQAFHIGAGSSACPGLLKALFVLHERMGYMPMKDILAPAIEYCKAGVKSHQFLQDCIFLLEPILKESEYSKQLFFKDNLPLAIDSPYANSELANFLELLSYEGCREFYEGEIATIIDNGSKEFGGHITKKDLANYKVIEREVLSTSINQHQVFLNPAPSLGGGLIKKGLDYIDSSKHCDTKVVSEALRLMDAERNKAEHISKRGSTTHISVVDNKGNAIAATSTNGEGNGHVIAGTGVMMNNILGEADLFPKGLNTWLCDERIPSMMSPTILVNKDGDLTALGSGGSSRIRSAVLQVCNNLVNKGQELEAGIIAPRMHFEEESLKIEPGFEGAELALLEADFKLSKFEKQSMYFGGVHAVHARQKQFSGFGDLRRSGTFKIVL